MVTRNKILLSSMSWGIRGKNRANKGSMDKLSELPEADQDRPIGPKETLQRSEPCLETNRTELIVRGRSRSRPVIEQSSVSQPIDREHLMCSSCETGVNSSDLYLLPCCHTLCLGCVRIEEGFYKCPDDTCVVVASVKYGELRANLLSSDYKSMFQLLTRGTQESSLCKDCYSSEPLSATHMCVECDRLMCHVCVDIHNRGDGTHLVRTILELSCCQVEVLMAEMQHRLGTCGRHGGRALVHFCIECDAFLCDGCLVEEHRQHMTTSVQTRLTELRNKFLSHIRSSYDFTLEMKETKETLKHLRDDILIQEQVLVQRITDVYEDMLRRVELKRDELVKTAKLHFSNSNREIELRIEQLEREVDQLIRSTTYLTSSAQLCSVRTLEENCSQLIQPCSLQKYSSILTRDLPACEQLILKLTSKTETAIRESGLLVTALDPLDPPDLILPWEDLTRPYGVTTDPSNRILVADGPGRRIQVFREEEKLCEISDWDNMAYPWGLAVREDSLFVTDGVKHSVLKYSLDGTFLRKTGLLGEGREELNNPMGVSCGNMVYVCDSGNNRVQVWSQDLEWESSIGQKKLVYPRDVSLTREEMLVVLDEGNPCLHLYNIKGNLVGNYGTRGPNKTLVNPFFIATDGDGGIIISDYGANSVKMLSLSDGKVRSILESTQLAVSGPNGVYVDNKGRILVCCCVSKQLIRFYFDK